MRISFDEVRANKRKSVLLFFVFFLLIGLLGIALGLYIGSIYAGVAIAVSIGGAGRSGKGPAQLLRRRVSVQRCFGQVDHDGQEGQSGQRQASVVQHSSRHLRGFRDHEAQQAVQHSREPR